MKWCVTFPEEDILIKRPSLKKACGGNKAAATFLSYLLYQVSISREYKKTAENINQRKAESSESPDQLVTGSVYRTQRQIIEEIDNELSDRTLRDTAIPWLIALGYIEVDDSHPINIYVVHVERVQKALNQPPDARTLQEAKERFEALIGNFSAAQTTGKTSVSNGKISAPNGKTSVSNGKTSVSENGPQPSPQDASSAVLRSPKNNKSNYEKRREERNATSSNDQSTQPVSLSSSHSSHQFSSENEMIAYLQARGYGVTSPAETLPTESTAAQENLSAESHDHPEVVPASTDQPSTSSMKHEEPARNVDSYSQSRKDELPQTEKYQGDLPPARPIEKPTPKQQLAEGSTMRTTPATVTRAAPMETPMEKSGAKSPPVPPSQAPPQKPALVLSERAQILKERFDAAMPWPPVSLTENTARHFEAMATWPELPTEEQFRSGLEWHQDHYPSHIGYSPGNYRKDLPSIQAERYAAERAKTKAAEKQQEAKKAAAARPGRLLTREEIKARPIVW